MNRPIEENTSRANPNLSGTANPIKRFKENLESLNNLELKVEIATYPSETHEIDAVTSALTAVLNLKSQTEQMRDN